MSLHDFPTKRNVLIRNPQLASSIHGIVILDFTFIHTAAILSTSLVVILGGNKDIHRWVVANRLGV